MQENQFETLKEKARAFYEEGKIDEAIETMFALRRLPGYSQDADLRELNRALRYADEGRSIASEGGGEE